MTKERRAELKDWALSYLEYDDGDFPVLLREAPNDSDSTYITPDELRALLDSDERLEGLLTGEYSIEMDFEEVTAAGFEPDITPRDYARKFQPVGRRIVKTKTGELKR